MIAVSILIWKILAVGFLFFSFHVVTQPAHVVFEGSLLFLSVQLPRINASNANASSIGNVLFLCLQSAGYLNCKGCFQCAAFMDRRQSCSAWRQ